MSTDRELRNAVVVSGHGQDPALARSTVQHDDPTIRVAALGALERLGDLHDDDVRLALADSSPSVRRRALGAAAKRPGMDLADLLSDADPTVVEVAAWACGEQETIGEEATRRLVALATDHEDALCREASVAALGAIGDPAFLPTVLAAMKDKATVRRRAVLALGVFDAPEAATALRAALDDRDWQVRQGAEDILDAIDGTSSAT